MRRKVLVTLIAGFIACAGARLLTLPRSAFRRDPQEVAARLEWKPFVSDDGSFRVLLPGTPRQAKQSQAIPFLGKIEGVSFWVEQPDLSARFDVWYVDALVSEEDRIALLDAVARQPAREAERLLGVRETALGDYPGREATFEFRAATDKFVRIQRTYLAGKRLYGLSIVTRQERISEPYVATFLGSFSLNPRQS